MAFNSYLNYLSRRAVVGLKIVACWHVFTQYFFTSRHALGPSMLPTFNVSGDWLLISKLYARGKDVKVGDVVSFRHPWYPSTGAVKRVVGLPGDFVLRDSPDSGSSAMLQGRYWWRGGFRLGT